MATSSPTRRWTSAPWRAYSSRFNKYYIGNLGSVPGNDLLLGEARYNILHGQGGDDILYGNIVGDDLYGDAGNDVLFGESGNDALSGGADDDRLEGGAVDDTLRGGTGKDILIGGTGNDRLEGGAGFDTYYYNAGDGADRIEDSDASGQIIFNGHRLLGGIHDPNDPLNTYKSLDGLTTYVLSGTDLIVNGVLTVNADLSRISP